MSKINNDGLQSIVKNIKNPLESIYNKVQRKGSLKWSDMKEEYDFIYKFLARIEDDWDVSEQTTDPIVTVNNRVYKPESRTR